MKKCYMCGELKPLNEFNKNCTRPDGHMALCRACQRVDDRKKYWAKMLDPEKRKEQRQKNKEKYLKNPWVGKYEDRQRYRMSNKLRRSAHGKVHRALNNGTLIRKPCEVCGCSKTETHHDDYSKPLEVRWLCREHHFDHHIKEREEMLYENSTAQDLRSERSTIQPTPINQV